MTANSAPYHCGRCNRRVADAGGAKAHTRLRVTLSGQTKPSTVTVSASDDSGLPALPVLPNPCPHCGWTLHIDQLRRVKGRVNRWVITATPPGG